jgi:hypothetical protein
MANDVAARLGLDRLSRADVEIVLRSHFPNQRIEPTEPDVLVYSTADGDKLQARYDRGGDLAALTPLDSWSEADLRELREVIDREIATDHPRAVTARWLFASVPTVGSWRYREAFQLVEPPAEAPRPPQLIAPHPLRLEVAYTSSANDRISYNRGLTAAREVELLLAALLVFDIRGETRLSEPVWTYTVDEDGDGNTRQLRSELRQLGYTAETAARSVTRFTNGLPPLPTMPLDQYLELQGISVDSTLSVPTELVDLLDAFYALQAEERTQFLRACHWFQHASRVWRLSKSAYYVSVIQAIETVMLSPPTTGHCHQCNRPEGPGPTRTFIDFVDRHARGLPRRERQQLYKIRSNLTHGTQLLAPDEYLGFGAEFTPQSVQDYSLARTASHVARVCLINWLGSRTTSKSARH